MMYGFGMGFFWLLVIGLIVIAVMWALRSGIGWQPPSGRADGDPLRVLGERYARGEIDEEEYRRRREVLGR